MKSLLLVFTLLWGVAWADTTIRCRQLNNGLYPNTAKQVLSIDLMTYVNHFSLATMMAMKIETDRGEVIFSRQSMQVTNTTQIKLTHKTSQSRLKLAWLLIDRTPRIAMNTRAFKGVLFLSDTVRNDVEKPTDLESGTIKTLNFECSF